MHAGNPRRDETPHRSVEATSANLLGDQPAWLVDLLLTSPNRAWRRERLELPDAASLDDVRQRLMQRTAQLERETGPRVLLVDWTLSAGTAPLQRLLAPGVVEGLLSELRRSATHAPRTVWSVSLAIDPTEAFLRRWDGAESYTAHFVRRRRESLASTRSEAWTDDEFRGLSTDLSITTSELRAFLAQHEPGAAADDQHAATTWEPAVLTSILDDPETDR